MKKDEIKKRLQQRKNMNINEKIVQANYINLSYEDYCSRHEGTQITREEFDTLINNPNVKTEAVIQQYWENNKFSTPIVEINTPKRTVPDRLPEAAQKSTIKTTDDEFTAEERQKVAEFYSRQGDNADNITPEQVLAGIRDGKSDDAIINDIKSKQHKTTTNPEIKQVNAEYQEYSNTNKGTGITEEEFIKKRQEGQTFEQIYQHDPANINSDEYADKNKTALENDTSYTERIKKAEDLQKKIETKKQEDEQKHLSELDQATQARQDAERKVNENPSKENKQNLADAIEQEKTAQTNVENDNKKLSDLNASKQEIIDSSIESGELKKKMKTDPPGLEEENEMHLKSTKKKYKSTQTLIASQDNPSDRKYINFKQDYVVIIRKKPFYAATAQQRYATADIYKTYETKNGNEVPGLREKIQSKGEKLKDSTGREILPEENYLRAYQVNNFINISINTTVNAPGTCSVTMKGAERVICAENSSESEMGFYSWSDLVGSWINIDENGAVNDGTGIFYTTGSGLDNEDIQNINLDDYMKHIVSTQDSSNRSESMGGNRRQTGQSWKQATSNWSAIEKGLFDNGQIFRTLFKTREAKYGWRFAEKCDWEPMDEILIFGKSHTLRVDDVELDDNERDANGMLLGYIHNPVHMFKMEPLFFGYIESVNKTYDASRGCMISINAKDQLKLMELCQACTNAGSLLGRIVPTLNYSRMAYGLAIVDNPIENMITLADGSKQLGPTQDQFKTETYNTIEEKANNYSFLMKNIMHALYIDEIVQLMASASGIPDKFLIKRIEPMHRIPPFWQDNVNQNLDFFVGQTDTRYNLCQKAAQQLMVEFFADEGGNIVVKIPNWVLGANMLQMNNCNIKYYDDVRYSDLPVFYMNEDGSIDVEPPATTSSTQDDNGGGGLLGKITGFINRAFGTLLDALGGIFSIKQKGRSDAEQYKLPNSTGILNYTDKTKVEETVKKMAALHQANSEKNKAFQEQIKIASQTFSSEKTNVSANAEENAEEAVDYTYANITDNVIEDILDETNNNVIQLDEYRIKVKLNDASDDKYGSLYSIAKRYYDNMYKWHLIAEVNRIHEPTEIEPESWIILYFNEPISDYIINSFDEENIHTQIQELKAKRAEKLKQLGIKLSRKNNNTEVIVNSFPFIKGEFISIPQSLKIEQKFIKKNWMNNEILYKDPLLKSFKKGTLQQKNIFNKDSLKNKNNNSLKNSLNDSIIKAKSVHSNDFTSSILSQANSERISKNIEKKDKETLEKIRKNSTDTLNRLNAGKADGSTLTGNTRFRSSRTDMDIPVIPNEYIISFTLVDSDQEVYNYIEVAGSMAYGQLAGEQSSLPSIYRCIPDYDHIRQFGLRQHPIVNTSPLAFSAESAQILGSMLLYKSQCNRYSGVLTCIEDSAIKVGNPVRVFLYDEHPYPTQRRFGLRQDATKPSEEPTGSAIFDEKIYKEQAVFYVESISRNIDVQGVSTMTLQLKGGRVMGMTNAMDILSLFYDLYYQDWQSRLYYYNHGGNNTAIVNNHEIDLAKQTQDHMNAWKVSKWTAQEKAEMQRRLQYVEEQTALLNEQEGE